MTASAIVGYTWTISMKSRTVAPKTRRTDQTARQKSDPGTGLSLRKLPRGHGRNISYVLDEDELPPDLAPEHRGTIARALEQIMTNPKRLVKEVERATRDAL